MTQLNAHASISIFQLIFFTPALIASVFLCIKHGFGRNSGWFFLLAVSLFRIAGGATQLATYSYPSEGLFIASAILSSFGLSTLLLASLGFLSRTIQPSLIKREGLIHPAVFRFLQVLIAVGLIIIVVGDSNIKFGTQTGSFTVPTEAKAGIIIIFFVWVATCLVTGTVIGKISHVVESERLLPWAVAISLPFILIRLIYATLVIYLNDKIFNLLFPSTAAEWTLSTIEEFFVVLLFLLAGFKVPKLSQREGEAASFEEAYVLPDTEAQRHVMSTNAPQSQSANDRRKVRWRGGIILTLIGLVSDRIKNHRMEQGEELSETPQRTEKLVTRA